jgi:hypothetical protein
MINKLLFNEIEGKSLCFLNNIFSQGVEQKSVFVSGVW